MLHVIAAKDMNLTLCHMMSFQGCEFVMCIWLCHMMVFHCTVTMTLYVFYESWGNALTKLFLSKKWTSVCSGHSDIWDQDADID
jgi:hypothetical protein